LSSPEFTLYLHMHVWMHVCMHVHHIYVGKTDLVRDLHFCYFTKIKTKHSTYASFGFDLGILLSLQEEMGPLDHDAGANFCFIASVGLEPVYLCTVYVHA
jgi:hypothetical protein